MKKVVFIQILLILTSSVAIAFPIKNVTLKNNKVSAGEVLDLAYEVEEGFQAETNGGFSIYLGFIAQNIFINSDSLNRTSEAIDKTLYRVTDLAINKWALPREEAYRLEQITIYEKGTFKSFTLFAGDDFYFDDQGSVTTIPVIHFKVRPNPNSDVIPPTLSEFSSSKKEIAADESFDIYFTAKDEISGVSENVLVALTLPNQNILNLHPVAIGPDRYVVKNIRIDNPERLPVGEEFPIQLLVPDHGANFGRLWLKNPQDRFYLDAKGQQTSTPVVTLKIKK